MITKVDATTATHGTIFYHETVTNADNITPLRVRVTGKCKTWKTRPFEFKLPVARGLYEHGYITHENAGEWNVTEWE